MKSLLNPAPLFDNGLSILSLLEKDELKDYDSAKNVFTSYFGYNFNEQLKIFARPRHIQGLERLCEFKFQRHERFKLAHEWLEFLDNFIKQRAQLALNQAKLRKSQARQGE